MKNYFLTLIFCFITWFGFPQEKKNLASSNVFDSLLNVLNKDIQDTTRINILNALSWELEQTGNYEKSLEFSNDALLLCNKLLSGKHDLTFINLKKSTAYNNIGNILFEQDNYSRALENYFNALKLNEETNNQHGIANSLNNIGNIYYIQNNLEKALENYSSALKIFQKIGNKEGIGFSLNNMGIIYDGKGDYNRALETHFAALKINKEIGKKLDIADSYNNIGVIYWKKGNYDKALEYGLIVLKIFEETGNKYKIAFINSNIGVVYKDKKNFPKALEYLQKGLIMSKEIGKKDLMMDSYKWISEIYAEINQYQNALLYYQLYTQIKDSLFTEESNKHISEMDAKYETEKKEVQIRLIKTEQEKERAVAANESRKEKMIRYSIIGGLIMMLIISLIIFRSLRITRKQKQIIEIQKDEVSRQKDLVEEQKAVVERQKLIVEEHQKEIIDSITYAKRLQLAILPPVELIKNHLPDTFVLYKPKDIVAGDFYWMEVFTKNLPSKGNNDSDPLEELVFIAAADCTGHGVPGAMVSVVCSNALNRTVKEFGLRETGKILDKVADLVIETFEKSGEQIKDGMDISLLAYNKTKNIIQWSGANNPLWYIQNGKIIEIKSDKQPIGKYDNRKSFTTHTIEPDGKTVFYLFTDGFPDQFGGPKGKKFMYKQFENNLAEISNLPMEDQHLILDKAFEKWKGSLEQVDDVTVIGVKI